MRYLVLLALLVACASTAPETATPTGLPPSATVEPAEMAEAIPRPPTPTPAPPELPAPTAVTLPDSCRPGSDAQAPYVHLFEGYCLLYPTAYSLTGGPGDSVRFLSRPFDTPEGPSQTYIALRVWPLGDGGDVGAVVARHLDANFPGQAGELTAASLGQLPALRVLLTDATGETAVHYLAAGEARLFDLSFGPAGVPGAAALDVAALERTVARSFQTLPVGLVAALDACRVPAPDRVPFVTTGDGYCLDFPPSWRLRQNVPLSSVILDRDLLPETGSLIRLSLTINSGGPTAGRTLERIAADYLAEITPEIRPTIRQGAGRVAGHPLITLDGIPGIYATRQAFTLVDGRLFALTITPFDDPGFATLQPSIAAAWDDVLATLRFLERPPDGE